MGVLLTGLLLSGCNSNLCSNIDKANQAYPYEQGVTVYCDQADIPTEYLGAGLSWQVYEGGSLYAYIPVNANGTYSAKKASYLTGTVIASANTNLYTVPSQLYFKELDQKVLDAALEAAIANGYSKTKATITAADVNPFSSPDCVGNEDGVTINSDSVLRKYGYLKFYGDNDTLWANYSKWNTEIATAIGASQTPGKDFTTLYKNDINGKVSGSRSCIATNDGVYGHYGDSLNWQVSISKKDWGYAWSKGFLEGLLVYPVSWLVDTFSYGMDPSLGGWGQIWAIVLVTIIVRAFVLALTFKSTSDQQKTQALQPQLAKIQQKYPNANTNKSEAARLSQEQMALYKRNKVNPMSMILALIVQFPVFISVWGALQGSAVLSSGEFLHLRLSDNISSALFNTTGTWYLNTSGWWTALILFLIMSGSQFLAMMLPQWINKKAQKNVTKTSANPNLDKNTKTMKWVSYGMLAFTIFMGFTLPSAMGVYWAIGALISMAQTVITQAVIKKNAKRKEGNRL